MKMKRLIIELCCAIALVACGNSQEPKAGEEEPQGQVSAPGHLDRR